MNTSIVISGQKFDIGSNVILWDDPKGLSLYKSKYGARSLTLSQIQETLNSFVLHHSVTYTAKQCHAGLIARGLSVNFIIDDDNDNGIATIYQCLDVKDAGYSQVPLNFAGPGVEICYNPQYWENKNLYSDANIKKYNVQPHEVVDDVIHGSKLKVFAPTQAQVKAVIYLAAGLSKALPKLGSDFPKDANGNFIKTSITNPTGMISHFNITKNKIDPLGFPFGQAEQEIKCLVNNNVESCTYEHTHK